MLPDEMEAASTIEEIVGIGFSELIHRHFAPQLKAAADMLTQARDSGVEVDRGVLRDVWHVAMTRDELVDLYARDSVLTVGD